MNTRTDKAMSERAVVAQENTIEVAETLGITKQELKTICDYVALCDKRIKKAAVEPITAEAELHIRTKFPNNDKALEKVVQTEIDDDALKYVEDSCFGFPAGSLDRPSPIPKAKTDFTSAVMRCVASPSDKDREISYAKALKWLAQMRVQQEYKDALNPVFQMVHHERRGFKWAAEDKTQLAVTTDDSLKTLMA